MSTKESKLGTILLDSKLISGEKLEHALEFSKIAGIPLGKTLRLLNYLSELLVDNALMAQGLIQTGELSFDEGRFVLQTSNLFQISFLQALEIARLDPNDAESLKFGNLLKIFGVSSFKIKLCLKIAQKSGQKLGDVAVKTGLITEEIQKNTVRVQNGVRKLKTPFLMQPKTVKEKRIRLGELLVLAGCIEKSKLDAAIENKSCTSYIGKYLVHKEFISNSILSYALCLQNLLRKELIGSQFASQSLKHFAHIDSEYNIFDFLKACNFIEENDEENLISILDQNASLSKHLLKNLTSDEIASCCDTRMLLTLAFRNTDAMRSLLRELKPQEKEAIDSALFFYNFAKAGKMSLNQALINFIIRRKQIDIKQKQAA
ncbi:MAG: hypothetical protein IPG59_03195 [Candidatus Melainabacteria bacterium]|nr:MAG: hypothetical protein IPG59_03195 [Candidatus Melainabacteria bacterium]